MDRIKHIWLIVLLANVLVSACSSSRPVVSPNIFHDVKPNTVMTANMVRYDDPKYRNWRWLGTDPARWDLVVFRDPADNTQLLLARVIALPGEQVDIGDGHIRINHVELKLPAELATSGYADVVKLTGSLTSSINDDHYYLLSDTGDKQHDSRVLGPILRWNILGRITQAQ